MHYYAPTFPGATSGISFRQTMTLRSTGSKWIRSSSSRSSRVHSGVSYSPSDNTISPKSQSSHFPPIYPQPCSDVSSITSVFQKAARLKGAILNSINMPAYAMWKDEDFGISNNALRKLMPRMENTHQVTSSSFIHSTPYGLRTSIVNWA